LGLKLSFALGMLWYLVHQGFLTRESVQTLVQFKTLPFVLLAGFSFLFSVVLSAVRLMNLLHLIELSMSFWQSVKLIFIGFFFNLVLPGVVGGDVVKGFYLMKTEQQHKGRSTGIVVLDRLFGVLALMSLGVVAILYLFHRYRATLSTEYSHIIFPLFGVIGVAFLLSFSLLTFGNNGKIRHKLRTWLTAMFRQGIVYNMIESIGILVKSPWVVLWSFFLSLCIHLASLTGLLLARMVGSPLPDAMTLLALFALILLGGIIPVTPGNVGWTELLASHSLLALGSSAGAAIFLYWRVITGLCSLPGGLLYLLTAKAEKPSLARQRIPAESNLL